MHQVISVSMALLVLVSTLSISVEKHYCGENLVDFAFFTSAEKCGAESTVNGLESSDDETKVQKQSCCKDVVDLLKGQDELSLAKTDFLNASQKVFILSFSYVLGNLYEKESQNNPLFEYYNPPLFDRDIHVLNEVFLI